MIVRAGPVAGAASGQDFDPAGDDGDVECLIRPHRDARSVGSVGAVFERADPPPERHPGIDEGVQQAESQARTPVERPPEAETMDGPVNPGGWMGQLTLVMRHPVILEQPVRDQMSYERAFEGRQRHAGQLGPAVLARRTLARRRQRGGSVPVSLATVAFTSANDGVFAKIALIRPSAPIRTITG